MVRRVAQADPNVLRDLAYPSVRPLGRRILVIPLGATEQHGPHLPLTTDTDIAQTLAGLLGERIPGRVVIAPAVAYGSSGEHRGFPGTLSIGTDATEQLLVELCRSAAGTWSRLLLLSAHGGNHVAVARAVEQLQAESHDVRAWSPNWSGDAHAGHTETSVMLAIAPERVFLEHAEPGVTTPLRDLFPRLRSEGVSAVSPNGILGDPSGASAVAGEQLLEQALQALVAIVDAW